MTPALDSLLSQLAAVGLMLVPPALFLLFPRTRATGAAFIPFVISLGCIVVSLFLVRLGAQRFNEYAVSAGYEPITDWLDFFGFLFLYAFGSP